jgi:hypothetical protein
MIRMEFVDHSVSGYTTQDGIHTLDLYQTNDCTTVLLETFPITAIDRRETTKNDKRLAELIASRDQPSMSRVRSLSITY